METKLRVLPPLKRFRLIQQQKQEEFNQSKENSSCLPAKKRKESRDSLFVSEPSIVTTTYCLPAKKRVWALQPNLVLDQPLSPLDLNVEYKPSFDEEKAGREFEEIPIVKGINRSNETGQEEDKENKIPSVNGGCQSIGNSNQEDEDEDDDDDGIVCAICQSTDGDPSDPIVFCDGCDLMVHSTCFGNPLIKGIPEGDWFCTQCLASQSSQIRANDDTLSCCLCPINGGAMKPTNDGRWAHLVCALLVPEVFFEDPEGREGIDCSKVPKRRWEAKCYICNEKKGCAIECSEPKCPLAFHVTCGLKEDLYIDYKEGKKKGAIVAGFCKSHTELWEKQQQTGKFKIVAREEHKK